MSWSVRNASQTTYALRDTPTQIRITNPIHPLRERTVDVIYSRRQGRETHWVVRLPDGSSAQIPSAWTTILEALSLESVSEPADAPHQKACPTSPTCPPVS